MKKKKTFRRKKTLKKRKPSKEISEKRNPFKKSWKNGPFEKKKLF